MVSETTQEVAEPFTETLSASEEVRRAAQALTDLRVTNATSVSLLHCDSRRFELQLVKSLASDARKKGFVTAAVSLSTHSLDALDELVRRLIQRLEAARPARAEELRPGLLPLLERFVEEHGPRAVAELSHRTRAEGATGDLTMLSLAVVASLTEKRREVRELNAWLSGTDLARAQHDSVAHGGLNTRNARRTLCELTRLVKALGYGGCAFYLSEGDAITRRTARQREMTYTVLRELVDNLDGGWAMACTRLTVSGATALFQGPRSLHALEPLIGRLRAPAMGAPAPPHRSVVSVAAGLPEVPPSAPVELPPARHRSARALFRAAQGLPPVEAVTSLSVGYRQIDKMLQSLFEFSSMSGSVFTVLTGAYGSGKTHLLLHLTERALESQRPVFRLSLERLNFDLGNPQRHLSRLLEQSHLPRRQRPSALDRLHLWTATETSQKKLLTTLHKIAEQDDSDAAVAASKVIRSSERADKPTLALHSLLGGADLLGKPGNPYYRQQAYGRFMLWLELLKRLDGCKGPVLLIDEAENLYTCGLSKAERRTALRSLAFYCGGNLPEACVVLAVTPSVLEQLRTESRELLDEIVHQRTALPAEDPTMLSHRLTRLVPQRVPEFKRGDRVKLAERVRETHQAVRGKVEDGQWAATVRRLTKQEASPRVIVRELTDRLEMLWWRGKIGPATTT